MKRQYAAPRRFNFLKPRGGFETYHAHENQLPLSEAGRWRGSARKLKMLYQKRNDSIIHIGTNFIQYVEGRLWTMVTMRITYLV